MQHLVKDVLTQVNGKKATTISAPAILGRPAYTCKAVAQRAWRCNPKCANVLATTIPLLRSTNDLCQTGDSQLIPSAAHQQSASCPILSSEMASQCDFDSENDCQTAAKESSRKKEQVAEKQALTAELQSKINALTKAEQLNNELQQQMEMDQLEQRLLQARMTALLMEKENYAHQLQSVIEKTERDLRGEFDGEMDHFHKVSSEREQHLLEDCEWKIREVEKKYKGKLKHEKEMQQELIRATAQNLEWKFDGDRREWQTERDALEKEIRTLKDETSLLKNSSETELKQVRGLANELQRGIKVATEQIEEMRIAEKQLQEDEVETTQQLKEAKSLVSKLKNEICEMKEEHEQKLLRHFNRHKREIANVKCETEAYWKENLKKELSRSQGQLYREYEDEKQYALEFLQSKKDAELTQMRADFDNKEQDYRNKIRHLQATVEELESQRDRSHKNLLESDKLNLKLKNELLDQEERFHQQLLNLKTQPTRNVTAEHTLAELMEKQIQLDKRLRQMELENKQKTFDEFKNSDQSSLINQQDKIASLNEMNETHETLLTALYHRLAQKKICDSDKPSQQPLNSHDDFYWQLKTSAR